MAKATKQNVEYELTLELTQAEAETLRAVLGNVGGGGPHRVQLDAIYRALDEAGVDEIDVAFTPAGWFA